MKKTKLTTEKIKKSLVSTVVISSLSLHSLTSLASELKVNSSPRPPQFVMMAFDGSLNLQFWEESREFAQAMKREDKQVSFTYFLSGVYFLNDDVKSQYNAPHHGVGRSAIGFGGSAHSIAPRVTQVNKAYEEGHEMGSHANGHYDAGQEKWTLADWTSEFTQFWNLIFNVFNLNSVKPEAPYSQGLLFDKSEIVGFRAPQLGFNSDMFTALKNFGFKYDTSRDSEPDYWPTKSKLGIWNFPLADLVIAGTGKKTLSMDYNFYVAQSSGADDLKNKELYKKQMLETYLKYFQDNYNGNRAPIHIGHHFSKWNGGAYWEAEQDFARQVCGLPEVRCVTYKTYMNWLESLKSQDYQNYREGNFPRTDDRLALTDATIRMTVPLKFVQKENGNISVHATVANDEDLKNYTAQITVNGKVMNRSEVTIKEIRNMTLAGEHAQITAHLMEKSTGMEIARSTQKVRNVGTASEYLDADILENRARAGDLPEAHKEMP